MRIHMVPNSHIDPVWLWDKYEGIDEVLNTFRSACKRLDEFPTLTFSASSLQIYEWTMKYDRKLFRKIRARIDEGRWEVCGGWWVEPDTNLPLESSFMKHAEISAKFAKQNLGVEICTAYVPDTFGHPSTLPKILEQTGFKYFIFCRPGLQEKPDLPSNLFRWEYEGHSVLAYRLKHHYAQWGWMDNSKISSMLEDEEYRRQATNCYLFGVGDHGGGPAVDEINFYNKFIEEHPKGEMGYSTCEKFFREAEKFIKIPKYSGDLHFHAIGCYSVMGDIKNAMRNSEHALGYATRSLKMGGKKDKCLDDSWKTALFNQFHDILPGSSSPAAAENAKAELNGVESFCKDISYSSLKTISLKRKPKIKEGEFRIFNTLPFDVSAPLSIESMVYFRDNAAFRDEKGDLIEIQEALASVRAGNRRWEFIDTLPASGFKSYHFDSGKTVERPNSDLAHFQPADNDDACKFALPLKSSVKFLVLEDKSDTWGHGISKYDSVEGEFKLESTSAMSGSVTNKLYRKFTYGKSCLDLVFSTYKGLPGIYADIKVKWMEHRKIFKMEIKPDWAISPDIIMQCAGGSAKRNANGNELPMHHWLWIPSGEKGMLVLQKGAFACDCLNGRIRLTLVRSSVYGYHDPAKLNPNDPQLDTDIGRHNFSLVLLPCQKLDEAHFDRMAEILNEPFT
ncbi:MAG: glycoside hydrolase family 38 C-terminal domain-containing protein, partial [Victivallales bacterium]